MMAAIGPKKGMISPVLRLAEWSGDRSAVLSAARRQPLESPAIPQPRRNTVDRHVNAALDALVAFAGAVALQEFDLQVIERVHVGEAGAD